MTSPFPPFLQQYLTNVELRLRRVTETAAERDRDVRNLTERLFELENASLIIKQSRELSEEKYSKAKVRVSWCFPVCVAKKEIL